MIVPGFGGMVKPSVNGMNNGELIDSPWRQFELNFVVNEIGVGT